MTAAAAIAVGPLIRIAVRLTEPAPSGGWVMVLGTGWWTVRPGSRVITGWIGGPAATRFSGRPLTELLGPVKRAVRWLDGASVDDVVVADWGTDPYSRGGYSYPVVGSLDAPAAWAEAVDNTLFFAGEATCGDVHPATVHGAYDSGVRAADEVLRVLEAA
jgi:monoamine oxidase